MYFDKTLHFDPAPAAPAEPASQIRLPRPIRMPEVSTPEPTLPNGMPTPMHLLNDAAKSAGKSSALVLH